MNLALTSAAGLVLLLSAIAGVGSGQTVIDVDCGSATDMTSALSGRSTAISIDGSTPIAGTEDDQRFRAYRQARGRAANFTYSFNSLPAGKYSVILGFAEVVSGNCANGRRQFSVALSGRDVLTNFDVYGAARACNTAVLQTFPATVSAASPLTIQFRPGNSGRPFISSIIVATVGGGGGTTLPPTGTTRAPTGTTRAPTGTTRAPTGTTRAPTGTTLPPTGTTLPTTGTTRSTTGTTRAPTGTTLPPTGTTRAPTGTATTTVSSSQTTPPTSSTGTSVCAGLGVVTRKDVKQMTETEWTNYVEAHRLLRTTNSNVTLPNGQVLNLYESFSRAHLDDARHNQPLFGLWHRLMLWEWDKALNRVKPGVVQPYFDWSVSTSNIFGDPMFANNRFGGSARTDGSSPSPIPSTSLFAGMRSLIDDSPSPTSRHLVTRNYDSGITLRSRTYLDGLVATTLGFPSFRTALEQAHNTFHVVIGGDMTEFYSPNEVLFYAHHAFIDKLYLDWEQASAANKFTPDSTLNTVMQPWGLTARQVQTLITPCVQYGASPSGFRRAQPSQSSDPAAFQAAVDQAKKAEADGEAAARRFGASQADIDAAKKVADDILSKQGLTAQAA